MNRIILIGVIGRDPEARGASNDIITTSLAVDSFSKGEKNTDWFNLIAFGERGKAMMTHVKKGKHVAIEGKMKVNKWERDGVKHQDVDIIVDSWRFVGANVDRSSATGGSASWDPTSPRWP